MHAHDNPPQSPPPHTAGGSQSAGDTGSERNRALRFVRRMHRMRTLGLALGFLCVASVLRLHDATPGWWAMLILNAFAWPHVAWWHAARDAHPRNAELSNLLVDSALGGIWVAVMQFNLLPSVLLVTMLAVDKVSVGGPALLARAFMLLAVTCAVTAAALGFEIDVTTPMSVVVACLPLLAIYPVALSSVTFALASRVVHQNRRLEEMGRTDELTGLANRRKGFAVAEAELERHRRSGRAVTLLMLDIDRFKDINDRHGHPAGDDVLCGLADALRKTCRATDTPCRYGGDEFLLILPETDLRGAQGVADRIRAQLEGRVFDRAPDLQCTVSVGAAEANLELPDIDAWIQRADVALYRAKAQGRDRFVAAAAVTPAPLELVRAGIG
jgi:diguanylate cyclase